MSNKLNGLSSGLSSLQSRPASSARPATATSVPPLPVAGKPNRSGIGNVQIRSDIDRRKEDREVDGLQNVTELSVGSTNSLVQVLAEALSKNVALQAGISPDDAAIRSSFFAMRRHVVQMMLPQRGKGADLDQVKKFCQLWAATDPVVRAKFEFGDAFERIALSVIRDYKQDGSDAGGQVQLVVVSRAPTAPI